jgi:folate-dependent phosphoribosylglycinamide formyltransferase PurN
MIEDHEGIDLLEIYCQSPGESLREVVRDLWKRRGPLAPVVFLIGAVSRATTDLRAKGELKRIRGQVADRIHFVRDIHSPEVLQSVRRQAPDLGLVYGAPILKPALFAIPTFGTLGIHHGTLPEYRGKKTTFWELYNGEKTAGVAIQRINEGLDTGVVVVSGSVEVAGRSLRAVWRDLEELGRELFVAAIPAAVANESSAIPERGSVSGPSDGKRTLYSDPKARDILSYIWKRRILRTTGATQTSRATPGRARGAIQALEDGAPIASDSEADDR